MKSVCCSIRDVEINEAAGDADTGESAGDVDDQISSIENVGAERIDALEASLQHAAQLAEAAGKPLTVKTSLHLYDVEKQSYNGWRGQAWKATVANASAAKKLRDALDGFFNALSVLGPDRLMAILAEAARKAA